MNKSVAAAIAGVLFIALTAAPGRAQDATTSRDGSVTGAAAQAVTLYELVLKDGSRVYGTVERQDTDVVVFRTQSGATVTARRNEIASLTQVQGTIVGGEFQRADPNTTRLFFAPTGRALAKGQTYLGVYEFIMPFVQYGVTDRLSIGGGTPLVFGIDEWKRPFWVTPKFQVFNSARTQVSIGTFHLFDPDGDHAGIAYVVGSHGSVASSFTVGGGLGYSSDGGTAGIVMVGGEQQVRRNMKLVTENYAGRGGGVASFGVRFFGEKLSADLALGVPFGIGEFFAFPVVNFVYMF